MALDYCVTAQHIYLQRDNASFELRSTFSITCSIEYNVTLWKIYLAIRNSFESDGN